eukprot:TRINITY_DN33035_c0_g1_i1.p1 TRINITY_DN33035_c0_g1~~TRINITY_DN33035_c0_g1_i1.p1  ORF type:complete len:823 (-),score=117.92 TRINITY_DN33035_c0_g1_i1:67-2535(-)
MSQKPTTKEIVDSGLAQPTPDPLSAQWHIDLNEQAAVPIESAIVAEQSIIQGSDGASSVGWCCSLRGRVATDGSPTSAVWSRWACQAERFATEHVRSAFGRLRGRVHEIAANPNRELPTVLALAGADVADHEATMVMVDRLVRSESYADSVALVGPDDFRTLSIVTKRICSQFVHGVSISGENEDETERKKANRLGFLEFIEWYHARQSKGLAVLLVQQAGAVPKEQLRETLSCLGASCCSAGIRVLVVLGLQHPPQARFDLLEGRPLVGLRLVDALCLFDARIITERLLDHLARDADCPLALSSDLLLWLWSQFHSGHQSLTHVLKVLALVCSRTLVDHPWASLCEPLPVQQGNVSRASDDDNYKVSLQRLFAQRLRAVAEPRQLAETWQRLSSPLSQEASVGRSGVKVDKKALADAAALAVMWRQRVCASLAVWDALYCATQPLAGKDTRVKRLDRLMKELWPEPGEESETIVTKQRQAVASLLSLCWQTMSTLSRADLDGLVSKLVRDGTILDTEVQKELEDIVVKGGRGLKDVQLVDRLRKWFDRLMGRYWQPLEGMARDVFVAVFDCGGPALRTQVQELGGCQSKAEALLALAHGRAARRIEGGDGQSAEGSNDMALLYRLLECAAGRSAYLGDIWRAFAEARGAMSMRGAEALAMQRRFGEGIFALHAMGLHVPKQVSAGGSCKGGGRGRGRGRGGDSNTPTGPFDGWRLKKQCFGRPWLKRKEPEPDYELTQAVALPSEVGEDIVEASSMLAEPRRLGAAHSILKNLPNWDRGGDQSLLAAPSGHRTARERLASKLPRHVRIKKVKMQRARIFIQ